MLFLLGQVPGTDIANDSGKKILVSVIVAVVTGVFSFFVGRYWGWYKAHREWKSKEFLNQVAIEKVLAAAKKCTPTQPLLPIPKEDRWYLLNFALNAVAEHFAAGQIKLDAGQPVIKVRYALFLTCEVVGDERIQF